MSTTPEIRGPQPTAQARADDTMTTRRERGDAHAATPESGAPQDGGIRGLAHRWPLAVFAFVTIVVSWPLGLLPVGPSIAAVITAAMLGGRREVGAVLRRVTIWRVDWRWYAVALVGPVAMVALAGWLNELTGADATASADWASYFELLGLQLAIPLAGPWEELGWRGFALPRLLARWNPLLASGILGVAWATWHLPLLIAGDLPWPDVAVILAVSIPFTALFLRTRGSVLLAFLMHGSMNAAAGVIVPMFDGNAADRLYWMMAAVGTLASLLFVLAQRRDWFSEPTQVASGSHRGAGRITLPTVPRR